MSASVSTKSLKHGGFREVVEQLRAAIRGGELQAGDRLPSFVELQARYATTPNTVNRALIALEQDGLIVRERRRGVFVADIRAKPRQHAIGVLGLDPGIRQAPYILSLVSGIQEVAHREEMDVTLLHPDSPRGLEKIDGVLLHGEAISEIYERLPHSMPAVAMMQPMNNLHAVVADDFGGLKAATDYLISLGHRRIACLMFVESPVIQRRLGGYLAALKSAGIKANEAWVRDIPLDSSKPTLRELVMHAMENWVQSNWKKLGCTAILCQNDNAASGVLQALRKADIRVPEDVSVIGFDSTEECEHTTPRLTSVEVPLEEIGRRAAKLLLEQIREDRGELGVLSLPTKLCVRDSTAPA